MRPTRFWESDGPTHALLRAAGLTISNIAHVIFLTQDVSFSKSLGKALPDRIFRQISLGDCTPEVAKRLVLQHLDADIDERDRGVKRPPPSQQREDLVELDGCIQTLGGRLTDLEGLARRIKIGESPTRTYLLTSAHTRRRRERPSYPKRFIP